MQGEEPLNLSDPAFDDLEEKTEAEPKAQPKKRKRRKVKKMATVRMPARSVKKKAAKK